MMEIEIYKAENGFYANVYPGNGDNGKVFLATEPRQLIALVIDEMQLQMTARLEKLAK